MKVRDEVNLWVVQRVTAVILAACVAIHLGTMIYAVRGGLTGAEILGRTRGNWVLAAFYATFVASAAIHAAIGLRNVVAEWLSWRGAASQWALVAFALALALLGWRAVWAVVSA